MLLFVPHQQGMGVGASYTVTPPLYLVAQQVHTAGAISQDVFVAGAVAQQVHTAGSVAEEIGT